MARGLTNDDIAAQLGVSTKTVDVHRANIKGKLGINDGTVRLSVGLEDTADLEADLLQAFFRSRRGDAAEAAGRVDTPERPR